MCYRNLFAVWVCFDLFSLNRVVIEPNQLKYSVWSWSVLVTRVHTWFCYRNAWINLHVNNKPRLNQKKVLLLSIACTHAHAHVWILPCSAKHTCCRKTHLPWQHALAGLIIYESPQSRPGVLHNAPQSQRLKHYQVFCRAEMIAGQLLCSASWSFSLCRKFAADSLHVLGSVR